MYDELMADLRQAETHLKNVKDKILQKAKLDVTKYYILKKDYKYKIRKGHTLDLVDVRTNFFLQPCIQIVFYTPWNDDWKPEYIYIDVNTLSEWIENYV